MDIFLGFDLTTFGMHVEQWSRSSLLTSKRCSLLYVFLNRHDVFRSIGCEMFHDALAHVFILFSHRLNEVLDPFSPCSCKFKKRFPLLTIWFLLKSFRNWGSRILSWKYLTLDRCFRVINPISRVTFIRMVMSIICLIIVSSADVAEQATHKGIVAVLRDTREMYCLQQDCVSNWEGSNSVFSPLSLPLPISSAPPFVCLEWTLDGFLKLVNIPQWDNSRTKLMDMNYRNDLSPWWQGQFWKLWKFSGFRVYKKIILASWDSLTFEPPPWSCIPSYSFALWNLMLAAPFCPTTLCKVHI